MRAGSRRGEANSLVILPARQPSSPPSGRAFEASFEASIEAWSRVEKARSGDLRARLGRSSLLLPSPSADCCISRTLTLSCWPLKVPIRSETAFEFKSGLQNKNNDKNKKRHDNRWTESQRRIPRAKIAATQPARAALFLAGPKGQLSQLRVSRVAKLTSLARPASQGKAGKGLERVKLKCTAVGRGEARSERSQV